MQKFVIHMYLIQLEIEKKIFLSKKTKIFKLQVEN